jgi:hypothetical protein
MLRGVSNESAAFFLAVSLPANADQADQNIFLCPAGEIFEVLAISEVHTTAGTDAGAVTLQMQKCTGTQAPSAGTNLLTAALSMKTTANTPQYASQLLGTMVTDRSKLRLTGGDRLALDYTGTVTSLAGVAITVTMKRVAR